MGEEEWLGGPVTFATRILLKASRILEYNAIPVAQERVAAFVVRPAFRITEISIGALHNGHTLRRSLLRPHQAGAMVAAHLFHSEPFDLVDDRIELRLPGVEYAQVQAAIAAVEAGCGEVILGENEQVHDSRMAAAGDGNDSLAGDVDIKNVLTPHLQ